MSMSETDPNTPPADEQVDDNLIDAERQALADTAPEQPEPPADPEPQQPAEPAAPAPEDRLGAVADKLGAVADALAARIAPEPEPETPPSEPAAPPRDFAAELTTLKGQYEDGDIDMDEYLSKRDEIRDAQYDQKIEARLAADREAREAAAAEAAKQSDQERWASATQEFFSDPANAALVDNPIKTGAFQAAIQEAGKQVPAGDYAAVLAKARELVGGAPPAAADDEVRKETFKRQGKQPEPPPTLRDVPNTSSHETPGAMLDGMDIDTLEDQVMQMTPEAREKWLASAPGGLGDNPRRAE